MLNHSPGDSKLLGELIIKTMKHNRIPFFMVTILALVLSGTLLTCVQKTDINGPLRVSDKNPRYFTDNSGKAIYLTGSHTWNNLVDMTTETSPEKFDYPEYISWMKRVKMANDSGIYVSIMLFEGWGLQFSPGAFENHPFHPDNNINGINGDANGDGSGVEIHTLGNEKILSIQETYVRHVIDRVNRYDNVLYEISNENHPPSTAWQYHMINFIRDYEKELPKQHPVGMTFQYRGGSNQTLFDSPADWISPNPEGGYRDNPPPADGSKVILTDTDHLWGIGGNQSWVWKSFLRGLNPLFMDPYDCRILARRCDPVWMDSIRVSMGYTRMLAGRMDLLSMLPLPELASSTYCLANTGSEYLVYLSDSNVVEVNLENAPGSFRAEWFNPNTGEFTTQSGTIEGGGKVSLKSPYEGVGMVLYLKSED